jgi:hypothetical protein
MVSGIMRIRRLIGLFRYIWHSNQNNLSMKALLRCLPLLLLLSCALPALASEKPAKKVNAVERFFKQFPGLKNVSIEQFLSLSPREYERITGNKLKWKEKVVYKVVKWKMKKKMRGAPTPVQRTLGWLSLFFGVLSGVLLFAGTGVAGLVGILFAVAGLVLGIKSLKGNNNAPGLIGLIWSSAVIAILIIAVIALSGSSWY